MKILQIVGQLRTGGAENVAMNILRYSDKKHVQIDFLVFGTEIGNYEAEAVELGATIHRIANPSEGYKKYCKNLRELVLKNEYDIVHSHTLLNNGLVGIALRKNKNVKIISHAHSTSSGKDKENVVYKVYKFIMRQSIKKYSDIRISCGNEAGKFLYGVQTFKLINNGVDFEKFKYSEYKKNKIKDELGIATNTFLVGHVGRLEKVKNHEFLIDAFSEFVKENMEAKLIIVGSGSKLEELKKLSSKKNMEKNILFLGDREDVDYLYSAMDVLIFPSLYEGVPLTLIEAQVSGLPCIVSKNVSPEVKLFSNLYFLELSDKKAWVDKMEYIFVNKQSRKIDYEEFKETNYDVLSEIKKLDKYYRATK